jgi:hypothetical protein
MLKILLLMAVLATAVASAVLYGRAKWRAATEELYVRLEATRVQAPLNVFDARELVDLPEPVARHLRRILRDGQPIVTAARIEQRGSFNMAETEEDWQPFTASELVVTNRPGFVWDARIVMAPGLGVRVHDAYVAGEGILHAAVLGLFTVADMHGTPDVAEGELMRFLAEAPWYPTSLLPSRGVAWGEIDDSTAMATLRDGHVEVRLRFRFDDEDLIREVRAEARGRTVGGTVIPTPWEGRWSDYQRRAGMLIPLEGEVSWITPDGRLPYWRGRITSVEYELARR